MKTGVTNLVIGILVLAFSVSCNSQKKEGTSINTEGKENITNVEVKESATKADKPEKLETSFVCFVNNSYMGKEQIPVEVDGKTYYGCCEGCVGKLKDNLGNVRFAEDPLTGKEVDKATAYIVLKPEGNGDVLYFGSEENYIKYFKTKI